jgi:hypothetical protein
VNWVAYVFGAMWLASVAVMLAAIYNTWENEGGKYRWPRFWRCVFRGHEWHFDRSDDDEVWWHTECTKCGKWR